ncbi:hypothetical protein B0H19DRAFT_1269230 [Mycena capillaripes]|nr:hypothetical protein B0H19DRAFT_1269230 [Mycena capillaripes]
MHLLLHPFRSPPYAPLRISGMLLDCIPALFEARITLFGGCFLFPSKVDISNKPVKVPGSLRVSHLSLAFSP